MKEMVKQWLSYMLERNLHCWLRHKSIVATSQAKCQKHVTVLCAIFGCLQAILTGKGFSLSPLFLIWLLLPTKVKQTLFFIIDVLMRKKIRCHLAIVFSFFPNLKLKRLQDMSCSICSLLFDCCATIKLKW